jgi:hypothetical protein
MAYIIQNGGSSDYTRADFVSALEGLQPLLVSGTNIKTINSQSVLGSGNIEANVTPPTPQEYPQEALLTASEKEKRATTLARINELNPIVNGKRKYMMFGFISDLHTMPTQTAINAVPNAEMEADVQAILNANIVFPNWEGEGNVSDAASIAAHIKSAWPSSDASYYGATSEPDLRLLGAIAFAAGFDAVFCGGDLSSGRLPYNCYSYMLYQMKKLFDKYITVPHYFADGNHDRRYNDDVAHRSNDEWDKWLKLMNSNGASYITANESRYGKKSNTYYVDFASHKVRAVMRSIYENQTTSAFSGSPCGYNDFDALSFENPADAQEWTAMSFCHYDTNSTALQWALSYFYSGARIGNETGAYWGGSTGYTAGFMNPDKSTTNNKYNSQYDGSSKNAQYGSGYPGKAAIGMFYGHVHTLAEFSATQSNEKNLLNHLSIRNSNDSGYTFSIFIIDDDNYKLRWLVYGGNYDSDKVPSGFDGTAKEFTLDYRHH